MDVKISKQLPVRSRIVTGISRNLSRQSRAKGKQFHSENAGANLTVSAVRCGHLCERRGHSGYFCYRLT